MQPQTPTPFPDALRGLRTYLVVAVILALLLVHWAGWIVLPAEAYAALFAAGLAFLRAAQAEHAAATTEEITRQIRLVRIANGEPIPAVLDRGPAAGRPGPTELPSTVNPEP